MTDARVSSLVVVKTLAGFVLLISCVPQGNAQSQSAARMIRIEISIDGDPVPCENLKVQLRIGKDAVPVEQTNQGFVVPRIFAKLYASEKTRRIGNIATHLQCGHYSFDFDGIYPAQVESGTWNIGIAYPPFWLARERHAGALGGGTWGTFIDFDTDTCEPCVEMWAPHSDPPPGAVERFQKKQRVDRGLEAAQTAFALAVFGVDYERNRDYLLGLLKTCLSSPDKPPLKDVCDDDSVILFVEGLYWRGDHPLLGPLLQAADSKSPATGDIEMFYQDLLEDRSADALRGLEGVPPAKVETICRLAGEYLGQGSANYLTVMANLRTEDSDLARRCMKAVEFSTNRPTK